MTCKPCKTQDCLKFTHKNKKKKRDIDNFFFPLDLFSFMRTVKRPSMKSECFGNILRHDCLAVVVLRQCHHVFDYLGKESSDCLSDLCVRHLRDSWNGGFPTDPSDGRFRDSEDVVTVSETLLVSFCTCVWHSFSSFARHFIFPCL